MEKKSKTNGKYYLVIGRWLANIFTVQGIVGKLREVLKTRGLEGAINFLNKRSFLLRTAAYRFLIALYKYTLQESFVVTGKNEENYFLIHFCCWGENYADKAKNYFLPSLLAKGNLPVLSEKYTVVILVHCDKKTKEILSNSSVAEQIKKYARFQLNELPDELFNLYKSAISYPNIGLSKRVNRRNLELKYFLLGALQTLALNEGLHLKAYTSFLMPDIILSDHFFSVALEHIENKKIIGASTFRTNYFTVNQELEKFYVKKDHSILSISGADMAKLQIEHLHDLDKRKVISEKTKGFQACPRFIFKTETGLILRSVQYHPVLLDCSKINESFRSDYFPIDDLVLKYILSDEVPYQQQVWLCSDAAEMSVMELSGDEPEKLEGPSANEFFQGYDQLLESLCSMFMISPEVLNNPMNRFFIQHKIRFNGDKIYHNPDEIIDSDGFVRDVYKKMGHELSA